MEFDTLALVTDPGLFSGDEQSGRNFIFCMNEALLASRDHTKTGMDYFLFHLSPDEDRFAAFSKKVFDAGCSLAFLETIRRARRDGALYILFSCEHKDAKIDTNA